MKLERWQVYFGIILIVFSAMIYYLHYLIFHDAHHIFIYLLGDIAFVFIEVLMVTLILHELLNQREKRSRLEKLNMVIGAFFSELGTELLIMFSDYDPMLDNIKKKLVVKNNWTDDEFKSVKKVLKNYEYKIDASKVDFAKLHQLVVGKRNFLLRLLENPSLLEHESFTDLLQSVFHLTEEISHRKNIRHLSESDREHVAGDIKRVYVLLVKEWLEYMQHLKDNYPYLFSLAMRTNPFDESATVEVK